MGRTSNPPTSGARMRARAPDGGGGENVSRGAMKRSVHSVFAKVGSCRHRRGRQKRCVATRDGTGSDLIASARELFAAARCRRARRGDHSHAGLGMGTLYRHFPTKDDLSTRCSRTRSPRSSSWRRARPPRARTRGRASPASSSEALALHAANRGLKDMLATRVAGRERAEAMRARIRPLFAPLIERAQDAGRARTRLRGRGCSGRVLDDRAA